MSETSPPAPSASAPVTGARAALTPGATLVGVPLSSAGHRDGIVRGIGALREAGLTEHLAAAGVADGGDLVEVAPVDDRGPSGVLDEPGLVALVEQTTEAVTGVHAAGRRALLVGGDCPVMLGPLAVLHAVHGRVGLVMLDGHEDAWPPPASPTGEAADSELAIALGDVPDLPAGLAAVDGVVDPADVVLIGPRDAAELAGAGATSVLGRLATALAGPDVPARPGAVTGRALADLGAPVFWLHVDLDVLSTEAFAAADYLQDGGLSWEQLLEVTRTAWADPRCAGASVAIYNADLDPDRTAATDVVRFLGDLLAD